MVSSEPRNKRVPQAAFASIAAFVVAVAIVWQNFEDRIFVWNYNLNGDVQMTYIAATGWPVEFISDSDSFRREIQWRYLLVDLAVGVALIGGTAFFAWKKYTAIPSLRFRIRGLLAATAVVATWSWIASRDDVVWIYWVQMVSTIVIFVSVVACWATAFRIPNRPR